MHNYKQYLGCLYPAVIGQVYQHKLLTLMLKQALV